MKYITNIDTLSALIDRLISENIKLHFFKKDGIDEIIEHQEKVIDEIKARIDAIMGSPSGIDAIIVGDTNFIE